MIKSQAVGMAYSGYITKINNNTDKLLVVDYSIRINRDLADLASRRVYCGRVDLISDEMPKGIPIPKNNFDCKNDRSFILLTFLDDYTRPCSREFKPKPFAFMRVNKKCNAIDLIGSVKLKYDAYEEVDDDATYTLEVNQLESKVLQYKGKDYQGNCSLPIYLVNSNAIEVVLKKNG